MCNWVEIESEPEIESEAVKTEDVKNQLIK